jgi:hypothetical protein
MLNQTPLPQERSLYYAGINKLFPMTAQSFKRELAAALKAYDRFVVCIDKTPDEFEESLRSLLVKAIKVYTTRGEGMRHGIALDQHVTVILSQGDEPLPFCGIYFNLHSPYQKNALPKTAKTLAEKSRKPGH